MNTIVTLFILVPVLAFVLLLLNILLAPHKPDESKVSAYECGFSVIYGQTRSNFQIHFYVVAILFLVFDLELILIFPLCVTLYQVSLFGLSIALLFLAILTVGFVLEIGSGAISLSNSDVKNTSNNKLINYNPNKKIFNKWVAGFSFGAGLFIYFRLFFIYFILFYDMNIRKVLKDLGLFFTLAGGVETARSLYSKRYDNRNILSELQEKQNKALEAELQKTQLQNSIDKSNLDKWMKDAKENYNKSLELMKESEIAKNNGHNESSAVLEERANEALQLCKENEDKINSWINSDDVSKSSMVPDFISENIDKIFESYRNYLSSLDMEQTLSLLHIIFCISILIGLYNLIMVFYSDQILKYFDLENKYPKFGRFLKLRSKFQLYYFTLNIIIILVVLLFLLLLNITIFLKIF